MAKSSHEQDMAKAITKHTIGHQESKFHIKTEMNQTILEIFMCTQHVKHNHHAKN